MRKLASIQVIKNIEPIKGADKIELAHILGWQCVVKKNEFNVGDKIIYCELDSVLPEKPEYEFLRNRNFRIKTIKLLGVVSQGLVLPLSNLKSSKLFEYKVGDDVTELIGITKYLSPSEREEMYQSEIKISNEKNKLKKFMMRYSWFRRLFLSRKQKYGFPYWLSKTDETRVQSLHWDEFYNKFKDMEIYISEKIDYQSASFTSKNIPRFNNWFGRKMFNIFNKL
jgi:tRNA-binding EMAP/Myf-like protein